MFVRAVGLGTQSEHLRDVDSVLGRFASELAGCFAQIPLKKPSSIASDGKIAVLRESLKGFFEQLLGRRPRYYAASISGSILIGLKRASRLRF